MSGHSKWATIKRKKGAADAKRGALFTKLTKNISVAARNGSDPEMNATLRTAVEQAKRANMPKDNIEKAILKGAGELPGVTYEEVTYEGYGPGGVALVIECVTDNTNRTVAFVRSVLSKNNGSLGNNGSVLYMFQQTGVIRITDEDIGNRNRDEIEMAAIDAGAEDINSEDEGITITTPHNELHTVVQALEASGATISSASVEWTTGNMLEPTDAERKQLNRLVETLEENEDINNVYSNAQPL